MGKFKKKKGGQKLGDSMKPPATKTFKALAVGHKSMAFQHGDTKAVSRNIEVMEALDSYMAI